MREFFKDQIKAYKAITPDVIDMITYKTVWSGERINVGDKVLYAFVYPIDSDDYKLATFLERELDMVENKFIFIQHLKGNIPVLKFKNDQRNIPIIDDAVE